MRHPLSFALAGYWRRPSRFRYFGFGVAAGCAAGALWIYLVFRVDPRVHAAPPPKLIDNHVYHDPGQWI